MNDKKIVIIGAGPTGLGAAYRLSELGYHHWEIYEKQPYVGGLAASFTDEQGFTWDIGGHVIFSHYPDYDQILTKMLGNEFTEHNRESWIRINDRWVPYPFQNNIRYLSKNTCEECLSGLRAVQNKKNVKPKNFYDWMLNQFGEGIVKYFMKPYNLKTWGIPLESMDWRWIGERVSVVDVARVKKNVRENIDDVNWGPNNKFIFPLKGGTGEIYRRFIPFIEPHLHFNHDVQIIDGKKKMITFKNGATTDYDILINTMPLDLLVSKLAPKNTEASQASQKLVHSSGFMVGLGFQMKRQDAKSWIYFPNPSSPFYRVTNFHNYSRFHVPQGDIENYSSLLCEVTYSDFRPISKETVVDETIQGLINEGMISSHDVTKIVSRFTIDIPYSYPVPSIDRDDQLKTIHPFLEQFDIYSRGRFGAWKYEIGNMDHSVMMGKELIDRLLEEKEEKVWSV